MHGGGKVATVFMRWLERTPNDYDRGIELLTLGAIGAVRAAIVEACGRPGARILDVGCGTGELAVQLALAGATVLAFDASPSMVAHARGRVKESGLANRVSVELLDVSDLAQSVAGQRFDAVVAVLVLSEIPPTHLAAFLEGCSALLAPGGHLLIADEVRPSGTFTALAYRVVRWPIALLTWLLTRTTTRPLEALPRHIAQAGLRVVQVRHWLGGSLALYDIVAADAAAQAASRLGTTAVEAASGGIDGLAGPPQAAPLPLPARLRHRTTAMTVLRDLWALFFRIIPPYPGVQPGLYAVGDPQRSSPVLVTANYDLTVRRLLKAIDGAVDAWLLVVDTGGVNVWCASGSGRLTAARVLDALRSSRLEQLVDHHALVLPQLAAPGVDAQQVRHSGWGVHWGPVRAGDIPRYIERGLSKSDEMRLVRFPVRQRLEMASATLGFYGLVILLPVLVLWRTHFWAVTIALVGLSYLYAVALPWIPGRDGMAKSVSLTAIGVAAVLALAALTGEVSPETLFGRLIGVTALAVFVGGELQGMSPLMRGEQANWIYEAIVLGGLLVLYLIVRWLMAW